MQTSDAIDQVAAALAQAQGAMTNAVKEAENPFFSRGNRKASYADLANCWDACRAPLTAHGLSVVQFPRVSFEGPPEPYEWVAKQSGETRYGVRVMTKVSVATRVLHASGQWLEDEVSTMLPTGDPQAVGSAITYLRRYALMAAVGLAAEDDDGEAAHSRGGGQQAPRTAAAPPATRPTAVPAAAPLQGYTEWLDDLRSVADEGTERLVAAWNQSRIELRRQLTQTTPEVWERLKTTAANVSAKIKAESA